MTNIERRITNQPFEVRANPDGTVGVRGYAAVFDSEAYGEVIRSSAFNRTLAQRDDIRLLVNHDGVPLARTKSGTLELGIDERGLWFDAPSLDHSNPRVQELVSAMSRKDIDQCSFAGYFTDTKRSDDGVREVLEIKATDVSIVTYPWYEDTETSLTGDRDLDRAALCMRSLTPEQRAQVLAVVEPEHKATDLPTIALDFYNIDTERSADNLKELLDEVQRAKTEEAVEPPRTHKTSDARALLGF